MTAIPEDRALTAQEMTLMRWLLEHGTPQAVSFLPQLDRAWLVSRCFCGCASIDLAVGGVLPPAEKGIGILADYEWRGPRDSLFGVFVFEREGLLAGLEVWSQDGLATPVTLPQIEQLRPIGMIDRFTTKNE
jgi:hypothetical protein